MIMDVLVDVHMADGRGARFIYLVLMMCSADGLPVVATQNKVVHYLLEKNAHLFSSVRYKKPGFPEISLTGFAASQPGGKSRWLPMANFADPVCMHILNKNIWEDTPDEKQFRFQLQTLKFMSGLCFGRNRNVTDFLLHHVDFYGLRYLDLLACVSNPKLPDMYRLCVLDLLRNLYINREPAEYHFPKNFLRVWCENDLSAANKVASPWTKEDPWAAFPQLAPTADFPCLREELERFFREDTPGW
jgi:hypothetical protein